MIPKPQSVLGEAMRMFLPRARRIPCDLASEVALVDPEGKRLLAGPVPAVLCNISESGCCIEMTSPLVAGRHLFYETLANGACLLRLQVLEIQAHRLDCMLLARSVWMAGVDEERPPGLRIGLQFLEPQRDLVRQIRRGPVAR